MFVMLLGFCSFFIFSKEKPMGSAYQQDSADGNKNFIHVLFFFQNFHDFVDDFCFIAFYNGVRHTRFHVIFEDNLVSFP